MVYFLSDLHLGARYLPDQREAEMRAVRFLMQIKEDATDVYLMGDVLDYWYEYRTVVPRGYVRFFGALAQLADSGVKLHWFIGNHDIWLFDYLRNEIGIDIVDGYQVKDILGKRFFLSHGDGLGKLPLGFRIIRAIFRNKVCQKLYAGIHPRWTVAFAHRWSSSNRDFKHYDTPQCEGVDSEPQLKFAVEYLRNVDPTVNYFIFGHRHVLADEKLSPTCRAIILGDWITQFSYATFDGNCVKLHHFDT